MKYYSWLSVIAIFAAVIVALVAGAAWSFRARRRRRGWIMTGVALTMAFAGFLLRDAFAEKLFFAKWERDVLLHDVLAGKLYFAKWERDVLPVVRSEEFKTECRKWIAESVERKKNKRPYFYCWNSEVSAWQNTDAYERLKENADLPEKIRCLNPSSVFFEEDRVRIRWEIGESGKVEFGCGIYVPPFSEASGYYQSYTDCLSGDTLFVHKVVEDGLEWHERTRCPERDIPWCSAFRFEKILKSFF